MKIKLFFFILVVLIFNSSKVFAAQNNIIEYSYRIFGSGEYYYPILFPPLIKIYEDGKIIFLKDKKFYQGNIESSKLKLLTQQLKKNTILKRSDYLIDKNP